MAGRNKQAENSQQQNASLQQNIAKQNQDLATENSNLRSQYSKPFIDFNTQIASGDRNAMMTAAGIPLSNLQQQYNQSRSNVYDTVAPGIGRDVALTQGARDFGNGNASYLNDAFTQAMRNLYGAGNDSGQMGLQQTGASLNAFQGSNASNQNLINNATQRKASTMGAFGSLANLAGGGIFGMLTKGKGASSAPSIGGSSGGGLNV